MNGSIRVFSVTTGGIVNVLENEETISEAMPISRLKCKPSGDPSVNILAATYVSGHLRYIQYYRAKIEKMMQYIADCSKNTIFHLCIGYGIMEMANVWDQVKKTKIQEIIENRFF